MKCLPDFLVIGGMKCATTTLHQDLSQHPDIFCGRKELNALTICDNPKRGLGSSHQIYRSNYRDAKSQSIFGDISTTYTMAPDYKGVAEKALAVVGPGTKVIYIVREPVRRAISHHQHMMNWASEQGMGPDINLEIRNRPELIAYSCYARQLQPWVEQFGMDNILVVTFESYIENRAAVTREIFSFVGADPLDIQSENDGANRSENVRVVGSRFAKIYQNNLFQKFVRPWSPTFLKTLLRPILLRKAKLTGIAPTTETIDFIIDSVRDDIHSLHKMLDWNDPKWDFIQVRENLVSK